LPGLFYWLWQNAAVSVETDRLISTKPTSAQEEQFERSLRPATLAEYVGQERIRGQLLFATAELPRHVVFPSVPLVLVSRFLGGFFINTKTKGATHDKG